MRYELIPFPDPSALAHAAAQSWMDTIERACVQGQPQCVALSGGRIALQFFGAVVENAKKRTVSLAGVHFFWADERCVPPSDPESNFGLAEKRLLQPLQIPSKQIHRLHGENLPDLAAREGAADVRRVVPVNSGGQPIFDIVFLGMGEDGHVASLFPETSVESIDSADVYQAVTASKPPPQRITLTYRAISAAKEVWVLASGPGKGDALRSCLVPGSQKPLARVLGMRRQTRIFTDIHPGPSEP